MKYFKNCQTIEAIKSLYKQLAKEYHPDRGGDTTTMQAINAEYAFACANLARGAGWSDEKIDTELKLSEEYRQVIEKIIHLPGIVIEIVGHWIWITGNTKPVKDQLREAGFFYAAKKIAWYYRNQAFAVRGNGAPLEKIRRKYGSETIRQQTYNSIEQQ